ncbi:MAG: response regulator [bacterium]|nr:response regulator [bacterium]
MENPLIKQGTILVVDDEKMVTDSIKQWLTRRGYTVLTAHSGEEGIRIYEENAHSIDLVVLDIVMPDIGGGEAFDKMKAVNPDVKALLASGYSIDDQAYKIIERGCSGFIQKPFGVKELVGKIKEIMD